MTKETSPAISWKSNPDGKVGAANTYPFCTKKVWSAAALEPDPWLPCPAMISGKSPQTGVTPVPDDPRADG